MDWNLNDRRVLITGAGDGIGRTLALAFADAGARVAGCARSQDRLDSLAAEIAGKGHCFHRADLTRLEEIQSLHDKVLETLGGLDVLVNNAGSILNLATFFDATDADWQNSFDINLLQAVRLTRLCVPALKKSSAARIVNISSNAASRPGEVFPHYSAMKAALANFTVSLAQSLAPDNICVNAVSPGPVWTRSWEKEAEGIAGQSGKPVADVTREIQQQTSQLVLLKRMGVPQDVAGLVLFLASDHASWITAANFTIDGGMNKIVH